MYIEADFRFPPKFQRKLPASVDSSNSTRSHMQLTTETMTAMYPPSSFSRRTRVVPTMREQTANGVAGRVAFSLSKRGK
jgi:hypothetical protein